MESLKQSNLKVNRLNSTSLYRKKKYNFKIQLIDCKFYNEEKLIEAQIKNKKGLELQDFYIPESRSALLLERQSL
jgi:hypothetical protein